jgi:hypothetical protein
MEYVTYSPDGKLTGGYSQALHPDHVAAHIEVTMAQRQNWTAYQANAARDGLELAPLAAVDLGAKWESIKALRDSRKAGGVLVGDKWFHSDDGSRIQQIGLVMMAANIPVGLQWKTMDGTFVTMTQTLAGQIFSASAAHDQATFAKAEEHRTAMEASSDPAAYDFSTGWPAVYGDTL